MIGRNTPPEALAAIISETLEKHGLGGVLSGGAAVQLYSDNQYLTPDLDFVSSNQHRDLEPAMASIGFERVEMRYYKHPDNPYYVEFPPGPVMIGDRVINDWGRVETQYGTINILTPTQCVMDRLCAFYHWNDRQCLLQAVWVAMRQEIDLEEVRVWSEEEQSLDKFVLFEKRLAAEVSKRQ